MITLPNGLTSVTISLGQFVASYKAGSRVGSLVHT